MFLYNPTTHSCCQGKQTQATIATRKSVFYSFSSPAVIAWGWVSGFSLTRPVLPSFTRTFAGRRWVLISQSTPVHSPTLSCTLRHSRILSREGKTKHTRFLFSINYSADFCFLFFFGSHGEYGVFVVVDNSSILAIPSCPWPLVCNFHAPRAPNRHYHATWFIA